MLNHRIVFLVVVLLALGSGWLMIPDGVALGAVNVALNKSYGYTPAPSYPYCTDPGDATQLTDGEYSDDDTFRLDSRTVGWAGEGPVSVTIDLEQVEPIGGVAFRSNADGGGGFPVFIHLWVRDETGLFTYGGEVIAESSSQGLPYNAADPRGKPVGTQRFFADDLHLRGRYIIFTAYRGGQYLFCDEIEVFRGDFDPGSVTPSDIIIGFGYSGQWAVDHRYDPIARIRMLYDVQELERHAQAGLFATEIDDLRQDVLDMPLLDTLDMAQGLPYTSLHAGIWALNGPLNVAAGLPVFALSWGELYEPLHPFDTFTPDNGSVHDVDMLANERRSAAVNVSNFNGDPCDPCVAVVSLNWEGASLSEDAVELRMVRYSEAQERFIVGTGLCPATPLGVNTWQVTLPAGVTSQLWLTFDSADVAVGQYPAQLTVTPTGGPSCTLNLRVNVHHGEMAAEPALDRYLWGFAHIPPSYTVTTEDNHEAALTVLKDNQVVSHWMGGSSLMSDPGVRNPDGTYSTPPTFTGLYDWLDDLALLDEPTRRYYIFVGVRQSVYTIITGGFAEGTAQYDTAVTSWFQAIAAAIQTHGFDKSRFGFHVIDEPSGSSLDQIAADYAAIAAAAVPEFHFTTTPLYSTTSAVNTDLMAACDIIIPNLSTVLANTPLLNYYQSLAAGGKELHTYWCTDGGRQRSPTGYFRRIAWEAYRLGMEGAGTWAFMAANQESTWDDFRAGPSFEMAFATPDDVTPTKMVTAARDGVGDFEYLTILGELIDNGPALGLSSSLINWAQTVMDNAIVDSLAEVTSSGGGSGTHWSRTTANSAFDRARVDLLTAIDQLTEAAQTGGVEPVEGWDHLWHFNDDLALPASLNAGAEATVSGEPGFGRICEGVYEFSQASGGDSSSSAFEWAGSHFDADAAWTFDMKFRLSGANRDRYNLFGWVHLLSQSRDMVWNFDGGADYENPDGLYFRQHDSTSSTKVSDDWEGWHILRVTHDVDEGKVRLWLDDEAEALRNNAYSAMVNNGYDGFAFGGGTLAAPKNWQIDFIRFADEYVPGPPVVAPATCAEVYEYGYGMSADINTDCRVDTLDLAALAANWLSCNAPDDPRCDTPSE